MGQGTFGSPRNPINVLRVTRKLLVTTGETIPSETIPKEASSY